MNFEQTGLPDQPVFRDAFSAGWAKYPDMFDGNRELAASQYLRGPVAMARLIFGHGGDVHQLPAAACLAGPAVFSDQPSQSVNTRLHEFVSEIRMATSVGLYAAIPEFSGAARLFCQASAILLLDQVADSVIGHKMSDEDRLKVYETAIKVYSAARGQQDTYILDTRFEVAMRKARAVVVEKGVRPQPNFCMVEATA